MKTRTLILCLSLPWLLYRCDPPVHAAPRFRPVALHKSSIRPPSPYRPLPIGSMRRDMRFTNHFLNVRQRGAIPNRLPVIPVGSRGIPSLSSGPHLSR